jgi:hypothetical protein
MQITPNFKELILGMKYMEKKEYIIYKILLDIDGSYIRNFKGIYPKEYSYKYLKIALFFYSKIEF